MHDTNRARHGIWDHVEDLYQYKYHPAIRISGLKT